MNFLSCPICTEDSNITDISTLKCGHVFHGSCIKEWLKLYPRCPKCRMECTVSSIIHLFIDDVRIPNESKNEESNTNNKNEEIESIYAHRLNQAIEANKFLSEANSDLIKMKDKFEQDIKDQSLKMTSLEKKNSILQGEIKIFKDQMIDCNVYMDEIKNLEKKIKKLNHLNHVLTSDDLSIEELIKDIKSNGHELMVSSFLGLKKEYETLKKKHFTECQSYIDSLKTKENDYKKQIYLLKVKLKEEQTNKITKTAQINNRNKILDNRTTELICDIESSLNDLKNTQNPLKSNSLNKIINKPSSISPIKFTSLSTSPEFFNKITSAKQETESRIDGGENLLRMMKLRKNATLSNRYRL